MFTSSFKSAVIAGVVAFGTLTAMSSVAHADGRGSVYFEGPGISFGFGDRGFRHRDFRHGRDYGRDWGHGRRVCRPGKAVRKARRRGVRRAHVVRIGRRGVIVAGRKWGERVVMGFGRHRSCPVRFIRAR